MPRRREIPADQKERIISEFARKDDYVKQILDFSEKLFYPNMINGSSTMELLAGAATERIKNNVRSQDILETDFISDVNQTINKLCNSGTYFEADELSVKLYESWGHYIKSIPGFTDNIDDISVIFDRGAGSNDWGVFHLKVSCHGSCFTLGSDGLISKNNAEEYNIKRNGTLGGFIIWPSDKKDNKMTLNNLKMSQNNDRIDTFLNSSIKRYLNGEASRVSQCSDSAKEWLKPFINNYESFCEAFNFFGSYKGEPSIIEDNKSFYERLNSAVPERTEKMIKTIIGE